MKSYLANIWRRLLNDYNEPTIGNDVKTSWENALAGKNGIGPITRFDASGMGCQIAGEVKDFKVEEYLPAKEARRYDRYVHYGVAAGTQAIRDAGLDLEKEDLTRIGCSIGSGIGGLGMICDNYLALHERGARRVSPFMNLYKKRHAANGMPLFYVQTQG